MLASDLSAADRGKTAQPFWRLNDKADHPWFESKAGSRYALESALFFGKAISVTMSVGSMHTTKRERRSSRGRRRDTATFRLRGGARFPSCSGLARDYPKPQLLRCPPDLLEILISLASSLSFFVGRLSSPGACCEAVSNTAFPVAQNFLFTSAKLPTSSLCKCRTG
jgi:hypothetical protein